MRDRIYTKYQSKQIINHVNAKRGERKINANRDGVKRTDRRMHIKNDKVLEMEIKYGRLRIII